MSKKSKKSKTKNQPYKAGDTEQDHLDRMAGKFLKMKYMDLQKECLSRAMSIDELVSGDVGRLQSWLIKNWDKPKDDNLLNEFDRYREKMLKEEGNEGGPFVRLGFIGIIEKKGGDFKIKKSEPVRKTIKKRERDKNTGIFLGTKKALTFQCVSEGLSIEDTIIKVLEKFSDAKEKSIKIWVKRAKALTSK